MARDRSRRGALKAGSRATPTCEPRQDRKVAAVSGRWRVPRGRLAGATGLSSDRVVRRQRRGDGGPHRRPGMWGGGEGGRWAGRGAPPRRIGRGGPGGGHGGGGGAGGRGGACRGGRCR